MQTATPKITRMKFPISNSVGATQQQ